jgi:hypothetical protein
LGPLGSPLYDAPETLVFHLDGCQADPDAGSGLFSHDNKKKHPKTIEHENKPPFLVAPSSYAQVCFDC